MIIPSTIVATVAASIAWAQQQPQPQADTSNSITGTTSNSSSNSNSTSIGAESNSYCSQTTSVCIDSPSIITLVSEQNNGGINSTTTVPSSSAGNRYVPSSSTNTTTTSPQLFNVYWYAPYLSQSSTLSLVLYQIPSNSTLNITQGVPWFPNNACTPPVGVARIPVFLPFENNGRGVAHINLNNNSDLISWAKAVVSAQEANNKQQQQQQQSHNVSFFAGVSYPDDSLCLVQPAGTNFFVFGGGGGGGGVGERDVEGAGVGNGIVVPDSNDLPFLVSKTSGDESGGGGGGGVVLMRDGGEKKEMPPSYARSLRENGGAGVGSSSSSSGQEEDEIQVISDAYPIVLAPHRPLVVGGGSTSSTAKEKEVVGKNEENYEIPAHHPTMSRGSGGGGGDKGADVFMTKRSHSVKSGVSSIGGGKEGWYHETVAEIVAAATAIASSEALHLQQQQQLLTVHRAHVPDIVFAEKVITTPPVSGTPKTVPGSPNRELVDVESHGRQHHDIHKRKSPKLKKAAAAAAERLVGKSLSKGENTAFASPDAKEIANLFRGGLQDPYFSDDSEDDDDEEEEDEESGSCSSGEEREQVVKGSSGSGGVATAAGTATTGFSERRKFGTLGSRKSNDETRRRRRGKLGGGIRRRGKSVCSSRGSSVGTDGTGGLSLYRLGLGGESG
ncbi:hypothetical protein BDR26DRAFT_868695 [Obelidium mucronatum]|nr:hypothetical protein BDR26DRAFT_868695 [Obelidium mucronatum]